ncbi:hypothetical protein K458DRAFT_456191 [Lentithecium fluviatile CBS 122367]|uniref:Uncharacterized protein n=1 Tax=Lentithecium fluviatile CBS 122367 TaxID=1168545 RepID=A0A6G1IWG4_9PLEO|nr:hypothetical protein K458DRAFT_456191 [Lentithecium fluviatile CBS 122367]
MHSPPSSGADTRAPPTARRQDESEAGTRMNWEPSVPTGQGGGCVGPSRGDAGAVGVGVASRGMGLAERANRDYHGRSPSPNAPSSAFAGVNNSGPRRLPTPPSLPDNAFSPLYQWHNQEHADNRPEARTPFPAPSHPITPISPFDSAAASAASAASAANTLVPLSHSQDPRRGAVVPGTPPLDALAAAHPFRSAQNVGPTTQWQSTHVPYDFQTARAQPVRPRLDGHMPMLSRSPYNEDDNGRALPPIQPSLGARSGYLGLQYPLLPVKMASSPYQPLSDNFRPPPTQFWTAMPSVFSTHPHTTVPASTSVGSLSGPSLNPTIPTLGALSAALPGQGIGLDSASARKQEAYRMKADTRKKRTSGDSGQTIERGRRKAPKLDPKAADRGKEGKRSLQPQPSQLAATSSAPQAKASGYGMPPPRFEHDPNPASQSGYGQSSGNHWGYNPASGGKWYNINFLPSSSGPPAYFLASSSQPHLPQVGNSAYQQPDGQLANAPFDWDLVNQPIVSKYEDYQWSVKLYKIDLAKTKCRFAQAWLEVEVFGPLNASFKCFAHSTKGFIGGDADLTHFVVLHNAADPFRFGPPAMSTTTIGVYGLFYRDAHMIQWKTFAPGLSSLLHDTLDKGLIKEVGRWGPNMKAKEKRFHRAYWKCANLEPLGALLNRNWTPPADKDATDDYADYKIKMTEEDVRNDDIGIEGSHAEEAWNRVLEVLQANEPMRKPEDQQDHAVLWSSEWDADDCARGGFIEEE